MAVLVVLDNGHGVDTPGKRSPIWNDKTQLFEFEFNRDVVRLIDEKLIVSGIRTELLVPEGYDVPLSVRIKREHKIFARNDDVIGISIHGNAFKGVPSRVSGWEAFTSKGQTEADKICEYIYREAQKTLPFKFRTDKTDGDSDKESRFAMVQKTKAPWVLTENGFMDNYEDCKFMMSKPGRALIAQAHVNALIKYIVACR